MLGRIYAATLNKDGVEARRGNSRSDGGDIGLPADHVFYCGRRMNQCRCGRCDGICGPSTGCPCNACVELLGFKINSCNDLCNRGAIIGVGPFNYIASGDTGLRPVDLYFCGKKKNECRCGRCDGICGPFNGCPCNSCVELVGLKVNSRGKLCKKGAPNGHGGYTGMWSSEIYYCGERRNECRCGNCNGICGPTNGCPCNSCVELLGCRVNSQGKLCRKGIPDGFGGDTGVSSSELYYCGQKMNECRCGQCTHGRCGPANGCPCTACLELYFNSIVLKDEPNPSGTTWNPAFTPSAPPAPACTAPTNNQPSPTLHQAEADESKGNPSEECIICLSAKRTTLLTPCGHYAFCTACCDQLSECPVCRNQIVSRVKVYEA